jgi:hypothetical protein
MTIRPSDFFSGQIIDIPDFFRTEVKESIVCNLNTHKVIEHESTSFPIH